MSPHGVPGAWFKSLDGELKFNGTGNHATVEAVELDNGDTEVVVRWTHSGSWEGDLIGLAHIADQMRRAFLRSMPYREYLKSDHWRAFRQEAISRAGGVCGHCLNRRPDLHVHHLTYERRGSEHIKDVMVLCGECHRLVHGDDPLTPSEGLILYATRQLAILARHKAGIGPAPSVAAGDDQGRPT